MSSPATIEPAIEEASLEPGESCTSRLLVAYAETLELVDRLGPAPLVAVGRRRIPPLRAPIRLPRPRWMLRALMVRHVEGVLSDLERRYRRAAALGVAPPPLVAEAKAVADFRASLPPSTWRLRVTALVLATLVVARVLGSLLPRHVELIGWLPGQEGVTKLFNSTFSAVGLSTTSVSAALDSVLDASPAELAAFALLLGASTFIVTRPLVSGFRLKRMLLNLYPQAEPSLGEVPASWSVSRSVGVYDLERDAFRALGSRPPREVPLDLIVAMLFALVVVSVYIAGGISNYGASVLAILMTVVGYGSFGAIRIAWLAAVWRARSGRGRSRSLLAEELAVPWRAETVRRRSPLLVGLAGTGLLYSIPAWWWSCAMRELRDFGQAHDVPELAALKPRVETALMAGVVVMFVPPFITILQAPKRVRAAQVAAGVERPLNPRIVWFALLFPVLCGLIQRELNRLWDATATPARAK